MSETYRKPDGQITKSSREYVKAWRAVTEPLATRYGLTVIGFDPHILVCDKATSGGAFDIPTWFALRLIAESQ